MSAAPRPGILLYDWDNTLVDGWAGITAALNATFTAFGHPLWTVEDTRNRVRVSLRESFPVMFGDRWEHARDIFYDTLTRQHLDHVAPMPGVPDVLSAGTPWPQGVVSNKAGAFLRREVAHLGWSGFFGPVVGAGDATADKPDPAPLLMALDRLGRAPGRDTWYIGDTALDMQAARSAGVTAVLIGDAAHDGGVERAAPDIHFADAVSLASRLRDLA
ncbi:MAG TPA: HAD family hydrolase [Rhodopila sp.]|uniref:HAD family hydrolase n=1 Tax=Rhodopila sp. TaxID=2480087 RepID=UPI002B60F920|nr:HAD family hydrolase [Rhodopila sp.]HVY17131.1 HAD family hydrolase [Rhodopila sp.]